MSSVDLKRGIFDNIFKTAEGETKEDVRDFVQCLTGERKLSLIANGVYGSVYRNKPTDTVLKVGMAHENIGYLSYLRTVRKYQDNPFFPRIYFAALFTNGLGCEFFVVKMERLVRGCIYVKNQLRDIAWFDVVQYIKESCMDNENPMNLRFKGRAIPQALFNAIYVLKRSFRANHFEWDLHEDNMMVRPNGNLVITDPWA